MIYCYYFTNHFFYIDFENGFLDWCNSGCFNFSFHIEYLIHKQMHGTKPVTLIFHTSTINPSTYDPFIT